MRLFPHRAASPKTRIGSILIVEDEPLVAFDNENALAHAGYHVVATVDRFEHAVEAMGDGIDLVIADIRLSGRKDGRDVARHAQSLNIPVLFSTATCPRDADGLAIGWIAKPYAPRDLVRAIRVIERLLNGGEPRAVPGVMTVFDQKG